MEILSRSPFSVTSKVYRAGRQRPPAPAHLGATVSKALISGPPSGPAARQNTGTVKRFRGEFANRARGEAMAPEARRHPGTRPTGRADPKRLDEKVAGSPCNGRYVPVLCSLAPRRRSQAAKPRGCGGIGRRVRFRSVWGQPHEGSSPFTRTIEFGTRLRPGFCFLAILGALACGPCFKPAATQVPPKQGAHPDTHPHRIAPSSVRRRTKSEAMRRPSSEDRPPTRLIPAD